MPLMQSYNACHKPYADIESWLYPAADIPSIRFLQLYLIYMIGSVFIPLVVSIARKVPFDQGWGYFFTSLMLVEGVMVIDLTSRAVESLHSGWIDMCKDDGGEKTMAAITDGVIHTLRGRQSTNPKDKSYALHVVLRNFSFEVSDSDYQESRGKVFHELLLDLLHRDPWAPVLLQDTGRSWNSDPEMLDTPSWVPDWTVL
ncbi:hypothetical protein IFR05_006710 [Cadophora sp. M221]|nr:hypothetical protein IFR05_006710 [Cadophora sp. M221]